MCTVNAIISHVYQKFRILFKYRTIHYVLTARLGLKYKTTLKSRLIFSKERTATGITFVKDLNFAMKEEKAVRAILVYMDESYCHTNHMSSKCWCGDGVGRVERSRSKGALTIMSDAMTKDGSVACSDEYGAVPNPEEFTSGEVLNSQMVW